LSGNVCTPSEGSKTGTTITFRAAGNAFNGIAKRMELWIDGTKVGQDLEDQLKITATLSKGAHTAPFVVVDTFDNTASRSVTFIVRTGRGLDFPSFHHCARSRSDAGFTRKC
jgi:hypothetical protein